MQHKIIRQYYVLSFLFSVGGLSVISATYATFLMNNGLNLFEINIVNAIFYLTLFICEIPTGAFADIFGRKKSFIIACGIMCVSMFAYGLSHTLTGFIIAEAIGAVGMTFRSGAFQSWLVDSLSHHGYSGDHQRVFGRCNVICQIGGGLGAIAGSYMAVVNPIMPWFIGGSIMCLTMIIALASMKEHYFIRAAFSWKRMWEISRSSIRYGKNHKVVRFIFTITCIQIFSVQALNMYWQPFFRKKSVSEQHLGYLFFGMMIAAVAGALIASQSKSTLRKKRAIIKAQILTGLLILTTALIPGLSLVITLFLIHETPRGFLVPVMSSYLQKHIPSNERSTITSFCAIASHIGGAVGLITSGVIAQYFGVSMAWITSGLVLIIGTLLVVKNSSDFGD